MKNRKRDVNVNNAFEFLENILKDFNIRTIDDLEQKADIFSSNEMIRDISEWLIQQLNHTKQTIVSSNGEFFCFEQSDDIDGISKYSCIFPNRTIIKNCSMVYNPSRPNCINDYLFCATDVFRQYIRYKPILKNSLALFTPIIFDLENGITETFDRENIAHLFNCGTSESNELKDKLLLTLPWLHNVNIEDYIEIIDNNKKEFENYNLALESIAAATHGRSALSNDVMSKIKEITINLEIALQKKQSAFKKKGITTVLGLCLTAIPLVVPNIGQYIDPKILSTFLGAGTIKDSLALLQQHDEIANLNKENPFWVIWKWKSSNK